MLVVAADPLLAALVGLVAERSRLFPVFPEPDERPEAALERERPLLAILVDSGNEAASDLFVKRAEKSGVQVLVFGDERSIEPRRVWGAANGVKVFGLPGELSHFEAALESLVRARPAPHGPRAPERRAPIVFDAPDGHRWSVYDRRSDDRRQATIVRQFVSDDGQTLECRLSETEAALTSARELARQLELARRP